MTREEWRAFMSGLPTLFTFAGPVGFLWGGSFLWLIGCGGVAYLSAKFFPFDWSNPKDREYLLMAALAGVMCRNIKGARWVWVAGCYQLVPDQEHNQ